MIVKTAEFNIKKDEIEIVLAAVREFTGKVGEHESDTFYEAYRCGDSFRFVHLMKFPDEEAEKAHAQSAYTEKFVSILYPCCENRPVFTKLAPVT